MQIYSPEHMPERRQPYIYNVWLSFIEIVLAVLANCQAEYKQAINKSLANHLKHYDNKDLEHLDVGWVALPICAGATMAYDRCGFKLPLSRPYLPERLFYQQFEL